MRKFSETKDVFSRHSSVTLRARKTERSEAWLSRLVGGQEIGGSSPPVLTPLGRKSNSHPDKGRDRTKGCNQTRALWWQFDCWPG
jgi:hypothetical protein